MLQRSLKLAFMPGVHVFPGGALDAADYAPALHALCVGLDDEAASRTLGLEHGGLAYWIAAIREAFEEAGILLAYDARGEIVYLNGSAAERYGAHRRALDEGRTGFMDFVLGEGLRLAADRLSYLATGSRRSDRRDATTPVSSSRSRRKARRCATTTAKRSHMRGCGPRKRWSCAPARRSTCAFRRSGRSSDSRPARRPASSCRKLPLRAKCARSCRGSPATAEASFPASRGTTTPVAWKDEGRVEGCPNNSPPAGGGVPAKQAGWWERNGPAA